MKYGCIGEKLGHSFSKEIHALLGDYPYILREIPKNELEEFMSRKDFLGINVTIPYKEAVIPYLYKIDGAARDIGAVNTVVNRDGKLYGYNTDFYGMSELFSHAGISPLGKKAAILGTGGTSKTAAAVLRSLGAHEILKISREKKDGVTTYAELYEKHNDTEIIVNTTPVGMFPSTEPAPIDISLFPKLEGVIDAVYNPLRTSLVGDAQRAGIRAEGGLYMLTAQAVRASEIFLDKKYEKTLCENIFKEVLAKRENTVLTGMPGSGKSTVGRLIAKRRAVPFFDTDELIEKKIKMPISEYFERFGEERFRELESEVIADLSSVTSAVIATGGGAVLRDENIRRLKKNGRIFFLDRGLSELIPTSTRPTANSREALKRRYLERYEIYKRTADVHISVNSDAASVADMIGEYK